MGADTSGVEGGAGVSPIGPVRAAVVQMAATEDKRRNMLLATQLIEKAKALDARVSLLHLHFI